MDNFRLDPRLLDPASSNNLHDINMLSEDINFDPFAQNYPGSHSLGMGQDLRLEPDSTQMLDAPYLSNSTSSSGDLLWPMADDYLADVANNGQDFQPTPPPSSYNNHGQVKLRNMGSHLVRVAPVPLSEGTSSQESYVHERPKVNVQDASEDDDYGECSKGQRSPDVPSSVIDSNDETPYNNYILNQFEDPAVALRIVDEVIGEFNNELILRLNKASNAAMRAKSRQHHDTLNSKLVTLGRRHNVGERMYGGTTTSRPIPRSVQSSYTSGVSTPRSDIPKSRQLLAIPQPVVPTHLGTAAPGSRLFKSPRTRKIEAFDPAKFYQDIPDRPMAWSGRDKPKVPGKQRQNSTVYEYTVLGELSPPSRRYTVEEISEYLSYHPLHHDKDTKRSDLTLWLQKVPADSVNRYPSHKQGDRCRFENCPAANHSLRTGEFRICFDEEWFPNVIYNKNPFHNAGYVHLYCLERNFNIIDLWQQFNFLVDVREFRDEGKNPMSLTRDGDGVLDVVETYFQQSPADVARNNEFEASEWFDKSLTKKLTEWHVKYSRKETKKQSRERGGFDLSQHLGDLEMQAERRAAKKKAAGHVNGKGKATTTRGHKRGRKSRDESDEESEENTDHDDEDPSPSYKRHRSSRAPRSPKNTRHRSVGSSISEVLGRTNITPQPSPPSQSPRALRSTYRTSQPAGPTVPSHRQRDTNPSNLTLSQASTERRRSMRIAGATSPLQQKTSSSNLQVVVEAPQPSPTRISPRLARKREEEAAGNAASLESVLQELGDYDAGVNFDDYLWHDNM